MSDTKQNWRSIEEVRLIVLGGTGNLSNFVRGSVCVCVTIWRALKWVSEAWYLPRSLLPRAFKSLIGILTGGVKRFLLMGMTPPRTCKTNNVAENDVSDAVFFYHSKTKLLVCSISFAFNFLNIQNREWSILIVNIRHWNFWFFVWFFFCLFFFKVIFRLLLMCTLSFNIFNLLFFSFYRFCSYFSFRLSVNLLFWNVPIAALF